MQHSKWWNFCQIETPIREKGVRNLFLIFNHSICRRGSLRLFLVDSTLSGKKVPDPFFVSIYGLTAKAEVDYTACVG
jgi:hypothetical protein